jgi:hypothetical protein
VYKANVANVQRWASERAQRRKDKYDEKLQRQRAYHESILHKLRAKHAKQIESFDEVLQAATGQDEATTTAELEAQYNDELQTLNAHLKQRVSDLIVRFRQDYTDRTSRLDGFPAVDYSLPPTDTWEALYADDDEVEVEVEVDPPDDETLMSTNSSAFSRSNYKSVKGYARSQAVDIMLITIRYPRQ